MPPPCPVRLLLPCFLASEQPPGWEIGQEQGKALVWPWALSKLPPASPLALTIFQLMPKYFKEFGPKQRNLIS